MAYSPEEQIQREALVFDINDAMSSLEKNIAPELAKGGAPIHDLFQFSEVSNEAVENGLSDNAIEALNKRIQSWSVSAEGVQGLYPSKELEDGLKELNIIKKSFATLNVKSINQLSLEKTQKPTAAKSKLDETLKLIDRAKKAGLTPAKGTTTNTVLGNTLNNTQVRVATAKTATGQSNALKNVVSLASGWAFHLNSLEGNNEAAQLAKEFSAINEKISIKIGKPRPTEAIKKVESKATPKAKTLEPTDFLKRIKPVAEKLNGLRTAISFTADLWEEDGLDASLKASGLSHEDFSRLVNKSNGLIEKMDKTIVPFKALATGKNPNATELLEKTEPALNTFKECCKGLLEFTERVNAKYETKQIKDSLNTLNDTMSNHFPEGLPTAKVAEATNEVAQRIDVPKTEKPAPATEAVTEEPAKPVESKAESIVREMHKRRQELSGHVLTTKEPEADEPENVVTHGTANGAKAEVPLSPAQSLFSKYQQRPEGMNLSTTALDQNKLSRRKKSDTDYKKKGSPTSGHTKFTL